VIRGSEFDRASVYDLLPTILYLAGLPVPGDLDGQVIRSICTQEFLAQNPIRLEATGEGAPPGSVRLSDSEEGMIEEKLRGLGYL
jgi:arylsulfatase A-like enzyme